jgi:hypothetical protein
MISPGLRQTLMTQPGSHTPTGTQIFPTHAFWIRCHANLSALLSVSQPALQVRLYGAYELYLEGERFAGSGNLASGNFRLNAIRSYPIAPAQIAHAPQLIAMRVFDRSTLYYAGPIGGIIRQPWNRSVAERSGGICGSYAGYHAPSPKGFVTIRKNRQNVITRGLWV